MRLGKDKAIILGLWLIATGSYGYVFFSDPYKKPKVKVRAR